VNPRSLKAPKLRPAQARRTRSRLPAPRVRVQCARTKSSSIGEPPLRSRLWQRCRADAAVELVAEDERPLRGTDRDHPVDRQVVVYGKGQGDLRRRWHGRASECRSSHNRDDAGKRSEDAHAVRLRQLVVYRQASVAV